MHRSINVIAAVGLALGGALGMAGAMVTQQNLQGILWAIDGAGLVMAAAMLAITESDPAFGPRGRSSG